MINSQEKNMSTLKQPKQPVEFVDMSVPVSHAKWVELSKDAILVMPTAMPASRPSFSVTESVVLPGYENMRPVDDDIQDIELFSVAHFPMPIRQLAYYLGQGKRVVLPNQGPVDLQKNDKGQLVLPCGRAKPEGFDTQYQDLMMLLYSLVGLFDVAKKLKNKPEKERAGILKQQKQINEALHENILKMAAYIDDKIDLPIFGEGSPQDFILQAMKLGLQNRDEPSPFTNWAYQQKAQDSGHDHSSFFSEVYTPVLKRDNEIFIDGIDSFLENEKAKAKDFLEFYKINVDELLKFDVNDELKKIFIDLVKSKGGLTNQSRLTQSGEQKLKKLCVRALQIKAIEMKKVRSDKGHGILQSLLTSGYYTNNELMDAGDIETTLKTYCTGYRDISWQGMSRLMHLAIDKADMTKLYHMKHGDAENKVFLFNPIGVSVAGVPLSSSVWDSFAESIKRIMSDPQFDAAKKTKIYLPVFRDKHNYLLVAELDSASKRLKLRLQDSADRLVPIYNVVDPEVLKQRLQTVPEIVQSFQTIFIRSGREEGELVAGESIVDIASAALREMGSYNEADFNRQVSSNQYRIKKSYQFFDDKRHTLVATVLMKHADDKDAFAFESTRDTLKEIILKEDFSKELSYVYFPLRHAGHFYVAKFTVDSNAYTLSCTLQNPYSKNEAPNAPEFFAALTKTLKLCANELGYDAGTMSYECLGYQPRGDVSCGFIATAAILKQCGVADEIAQALPKVDDDVDAKKESLNKLRLAVAKKIIRDSEQSALADALLEEDGVIRNWRKATKETIRNDQKVEEQRSKILQNDEEKDSYLSLIPDLSKIKAIDDDFVDLQQDDTDKRVLNSTISYGENKANQKVHVKRHPGSGGSIKFEVVGSKLEDLTPSQQKEVFRKILKLVYAERAQLFEQLGGINPKDPKKGITLDLTQLTGVFDKFTDEEIKEIAFNLFDDADKSFASIKIRKGSLIANPRFVEENSKKSESKKDPAEKEKELKERATHAFAENEVRENFVESMSGLVTHKGPIKLLVKGINQYPELVAAFIDDDKEFVKGYAKGTPLEDEAVAEFKKLLVAASKEDIKRLAFSPLPEEGSEDYESLYSFLLGLQIPKDYLVSVVETLGQKLEDLDKGRSWLQALHITSSNVMQAAESLGLPATMKLKDVEALVRMLAKSREDGGISTLESFKNGVNTASSYHDMNAAMHKQKSWFEKGIYDPVIEPIINATDSVTQTIAKPVNAAARVMMPSVRNKVASTYNGMIQEMKGSLKNPITQATNGFLLGGPWGMARNFLPGPLKFGAFAWGMFKLAKPALTTANHYVITPVLGKVVAGAAVLGIDGSRANNYILQPLSKAGQLAIEGAYAAPSVMTRMACQADRLLHVEVQNPGQLPDWVQQQRNMTGQPGMSLQGDKQYFEGQCELVPSPLYATVLAFMASPVALAAAGTAGGFLLVCAAVDKVYQPEENVTALGAVKNGMATTAGAIFEWASKALSMEDGKLHTSLNMGDEEDLYVGMHEPRIEEIDEDELSGAETGSLVDEDDLHVGMHEPRIEEIDEDEFSGAETGSSVDEDEFFEAETGSSVDEDEFFEVEGGGADIFKVDPKDLDLADGVSIVEDDILSVSRGFSSDEDADEEFFDEASLSEEEYVGDEEELDINSNLSLKV